MAKNVVKITETEFRKMISESIEEMFNDGIDIGKELQLFLHNMSHKIYGKWGQSTNPTKRDYLIAKHFYELGKGEQED